MDFIRRSTKWIMLTGGLLTCTMFHAAISPTASQKATLGS
jgi:hypothetical protein